MNFINNTDIAWAAGFFDGEGCVQAYWQKHPRREAKFLSTSLVAHNTDLRPIKRLQELFGGSVTSENGRIWKWKIGGEEAEDAARKMLFHTSAKFEQLELFIQLRETFDGTREHVEKRELLVSEIKAQKKVHLP